MAQPKLATAERIAEEIAGAIRRGEWRPGERLREQDLAARFETSRGPIREALRILDSKFWVKIEAGRGARVIEADRTTHVDATLISQALHGVAARFAATRATPEEQDEIDAAARDLARAAMEGIGPEAFADKSWRIGAMVVRVSRSTRLSEMVQPFSSGGLVMTAYETLQLRSQRIAAARLWIDLAVAIRLRDSAGAEAAMRAITDRAIRASLRSLVEPDIWIDKGND